MRHSKIRHKRLDGIHCYHVTDDHTFVMIVALPQIDEEQTR